MTLSAGVLALLGVAASFLPQEILAHAGSAGDPSTTTVVQIAGALYLGVGILNWSARGNLLGGIYGRPTGLANFAHFAIGAIVLVKAAPRSHGDAEVLAITAIYAILAAWFGWVLFGPGPKRT
jgi:hypothetical protein